MSSSSREQPFFDTDKEALYLIGAGLAAVFLFSAIASAFESSDLQVSLNRDRYSFSIRNVGDGPVTITDIGVNDRPECATGSAAAALNWMPNTPFPPQKFQPKVLKVGDSSTSLSPCQVVRVKIETNKGTTTFSFN